jgi:CHAT domain-containing protein
VVSALRRSLEFSEQGTLPVFDRATAGELHAALIQPFAADLAKVKHLVLVTQGPLAALPLAVLAPADAKPDRDADWLLRHLALSQAPSLQAWLATRALPERKSATMTLMGWGDPQFGAAQRAADTRGTKRGTTGNAVRSAAAFVLAGPAGAPAAAGQTARAAAPLARREAPDPAAAFPSLPETRDELLAIAQALGVDPERHLFLGARATRSSVLQASRSGRLAQSRVVAFATHGLKAGQWPGLDQPALVMAIPPAVPGQAAAEHMLSLDDTLGLKLDADWVVLSACNTTAGDQEAGEALSGLARGMFYAGARSLLATHWAVETQSAGRIVAGTFAAYAGHAQPGKAQALRSAMLAVMQTPATAHPAFWAPYVVIGDGGR